MDLRRGRSSLDVATDVTNPSHCDKPRHFMYSIERRRFLQSLPGIVATKFIVLGLGRRWMER